MASAWGYNLAILKGRWPKIAQAIEAATLDDCTAITGTPAQTFTYKGKQVTSAFDPLDEAKRQAEGLDRDTEDAIYCYGVGLGHLPAVLAARHKLVCVVIMNASITRAAMEASEQRWLSAPHVALAMAEDVSILYVPFASVPMDCRYADKQGYATRDRLFSHVNQRCIDTFHFGRNAERDSGHVLANNEHIKVDKHIGEVFGTAKGQRAIIVGGGPTLLAELEWLRQEQTQGAKVIAASTALRLLLSHGVKPDFTLVVDTEPRMMGHLEGVTPEQTSNLALLYHPTVVPGFIAKWTGPRYYYADPKELYTSGTVMHTAADLAVKLGASEVVMVGCDFCYPGQHSHIPDTMDYTPIEMRPTLIETLDGHGELVYTDYNLAQYHRHMEDYITHSGKSAQWFKRGKGGVSVRGAEWII